MFFLSLLTIGNIPENQHGHFRCSLDHESVPRELGGKRGAVETPHRRFPDGRIHGNRLVSRFIFRQKSADFCPEKFRLVTTQHLVRGGVGRRNPPLRVKRDHTVDAVVEQRTVLGLALPDLPKSGVQPPVQLHECIVHLLKFLDARLERSNEPGLGRKGGEIFRELPKRPDDPPAQHPADDEYQAQHPGHCADRHETQIPVDLVQLVLRPCQDIGRCGQGLHDVQPHLKYHSPLRCFVKSNFR